MDFTAMLRDAVMLESCGLLTYLFTLLINVKRYLRFELSGSLTVFTKHVQSTWCYIPQYVAERWQGHFASAT